MLFGYYFYGSVCAFQPTADILRSQRNGAGRALLGLSAASLREPTSSNDRFSTDTVRTIVGYTALTQKIISSFLTIFAGGCHCCNRLTIAIKNAQRTSLAGGMSVVSVTPMLPSHRITTTKTRRLRRWSESNSSNGSNCRRSIKLSTITSST